MVNLIQGAPGVPQGAMVDSEGNPTGIWYSFFINLYNRTGGATGNISTILDGISQIPGAILFRGLQLWQGLNLGAQYEVLQAGEDAPEYGLLGPNNFSPQSQNTFLAGPTAEAGTPSFRPIGTSDLDGVAGQFPGTDTGDNAQAGNVGEYIAAQVSTGSAVSFSTGASKDIASITLTPGDWDVWGSVTTVPAGSTTQSDIRGWINTTSASDPGPPNQGAYAELNLSIAAGLSQTLSLSSTRVSVAEGGTQQVYLSAKVAFSASTLGVAGFIGARRRR